MQVQMWPEGIKRTKQREDVFDVLTQATQPLSAIDIHKKIEEKDGKCNYAISTIYRALAIFEEKGYVEKSNLIGEDNAVYEWTQGGHKHYAVCLKCHKLVALEHCPFEHIKIKNGKSDDFTITGHKLELYGYCKECSELEKND